MTALDLEAEYNNRARVPEHPQIIEGWARDAAAYRKDCPNTALDQQYGARARNTYDFFPATSEVKQPLTAMFIHGGYWQALDKSFFSHMAKGLNAQGFDVAIANYTLCPDATISEIIAEMQALAAHLSKTHGKPLLVYGHSAGGHLSAALMATDWTEHGFEEGIIAAAMPISGLFELAPLIPTSLNGALGLTEETARDTSPLFWPKPMNGRFCAVVGGDESSEFLRHSRALAEAWDGPSLKGTLDIVEGANHFTVIGPLADKDSQLVAALVKLAAAFDLA